MDKGIFQNNIWKETEKYYEQIREQKEHDIDNEFNIFTAISESWHLENTHSKFIALILDPNGSLN